MLPGSLFQQVCLAEVEGKTTVSLLTNEIVHFLFTWKNIVPVGGGGGEEKTDLLVDGTHSATG